MKNKEIRLVGKQILENSDELEEGYVEVVLVVDDILGEIDDDVIKDYAKWDLNMRHEDDFESSLDDFDEDELVEALKDSGYNFSKQIGEEDCIEFLEERGYIVSTSKEMNEYDYVDNCLFEDISSVFDSLDCFSRQKLRDLIINFK